MNVTGKITFKIKGAKIGKLMNRLFQENIACKNLSQSDETLTGECALKNKTALERLCTDLELEYEFTENKNLISAVKWLFNRKGLIAGFFAGLVLITYLSNTMLRLNIIGADEELSRKIEEYLVAQNVTYGCFIPKLDFFQLETAIMHDVEGVAWAGVYDTGGTLNVDVIPATQKAEYSQRRLPSNLIADHEGQIIAAEIYGGELVVPIGSGVHKGQLLVSGEIKLDDERTVFKRSIGKVYAQYTERMVFECPYVSTRKMTLDEQCFDKEYINFFSLEIPAFMSDPPEGMYITEEKTNALSFLGLKLPVGYKTVKYTPYIFSETRYTENQATYEVYRLMSNYEANFLTDCEVTGKQEKFEVTEKGVILTVDYTVVRNIAVEKEFLVKQMNPPPEISENEESKS